MTGLFLKKRVGALMAATFLTFSTSPILAATEQDVKEGAYLVAAGGCLACHTSAEKDAVPFAGGHALKTPFGVFYTPNITPDIQTGIGGWSEDNFLKALKMGIRPNGSHYFPSFPYTSYTRMSDDDALKIFAYLNALPATKRNNQPHDVSAPFSWRWLQAGWKLLFFDQGNYQTRDTVSPSVNRGGYLVEALSHCGECHTPRNQMGGRDLSRKMGGFISDQKGGSVPNITPDPKTGIGEWSKGDLIYFLETGSKPDFDDVQGAMELVISHGTSKLTKEDREAMADYLLALAPVVLTK
jgi:mono/diheme cytochrome c family protein